MLGFADIINNHACTAATTYTGALPNVASPPQITVAGAISTGTHGSGLHFPSFAAMVAEIELVTADGAVLLLKRGQDELFNAAATAFGTLGVITSVTMDIVPE